MSTKTIKWILLIVGIFLIILAFILGVSGQDRSFYISWDYYFEKGSDDVIKLKIYELTADSLFKKVLADSVSPTWTTHRFTIQNDGECHYFAMTAIDTAGNESDLSNIAILDLNKPIKIFGVKITY